MILSLQFNDTMGLWAPMPELFSKHLKRWRGRRYQKEAASDLDAPLPTYRKWESGKSTPNKWAMADLLRRMENMKEVQ